MDRLKDGAEGRYAPSSDLRGAHLRGDEGHQPKEQARHRLGALHGEQRLLRQRAGTIAAILLAAGLADKGLHAPGRPEVLADSAWYRLLADNAGLIATALTAALAYLTGPTCAELMIRSLSLSCAGQSQALLIIAAVLVYLGVLDQGFLSRSPDRPARE